MKKQLLTLAVAAGLLATAGTAQAELKVKWFGFAQVTGEMLDQGQSKKPTPANSGDTDGIDFGADRVRIGFKIKDGNVFGKLQVDFNKNGKGSPEGTLDEIIKDVEVGYKWSNAFKIKMGQYKTPLGMDFNVSGKKLDLTKRGMEKKLVLERTIGLMLSGRKIGGGFGYDIFFGNPAGRGSASVTKGVYKDSGDNSTLASSDNATGSENTIVGRVMYDMGKMMHMELAIGIEDASGTNFNVNDTVLGNINVKQDDYEVIDFGFRFASGPMTVKFEWIDGENVKGISGEDETVYFLHYGHKIGKKIELVARYYNADQSSSFQADRDLQNTYFGANFFLGSNKTNGRVQVNYVLVGGDDIDAKDGTGTSMTYNGAAKGYVDNAILTQYQMSF